MSREIERLRQHALDGFFYGVLVGVVLGALSISWARGKREVQGTSWYRSDRVEYIDTPRWNLTTMHSRGSAGSGITVKQQGDNNRVQVYHDGKLIGWWYLAASEVYVRTGDGTEFRLEVE